MEDQREENMENKSGFTVDKGVMGGKAGTAPQPVAGARLEYGGL